MSFYKDEICDIDDYLNCDSLTLLHDGKQSGRFMRWLIILSGTFGILNESSAGPRRFINNNSSGIIPFAGMDLAFDGNTGKTTVWWKNGQYVVLNFGDVAYNRNSNRYIVAMEDGCWLVG